MEGSAVWSNNTGNFDTTNTQLLSLISYDPLFLFSWYLFYLWFDLAF